jgi:hypothetical protein
VACSTVYTHRLITFVLLERKKVEEMGGRASKSYDRFRFLRGGCSVLSSPPFPFLYAASVRSPSVSVIRTVLVAQHSLARAVVWWCALEKLESVHSLPPTQPQVPLHPPTKEHPPAIPPRLMYHPHTVPHVQYHTLPKDTSPHLPAPLQPMIPTLTTTRPNSHMQRSLLSGSSSGLLLEIQLTRND